MRAVGDFEALGERTLWLDCDVLQADGGTRCAAISGAYVAARRALDRFGLAQGAAATRWRRSRSGVVGGEPLLDLDYSEDSTADVDLNVVMTGDGRLVEVQATAEREPFGREQLDELLELAAAGIERIRAEQQRAVDADRALTSSRSRWGARSLRLAVAAALGAAIGLERELREQAAGLRTHMLVALGAALFTLVSAYGFDVVRRHGKAVDPTRIAAQIVTGHRLPRRRARSSATGFTVRGADDGGDPLGRRGDRDRGGRRLLAGSGDRDGHRRRRPARRSKWVDRSCGVPEHGPTSSSVELARGRLPCAVFEAVEELDVGSTSLHRADAEGGGSISQRDSAAGAARAAVIGRLSRLDAGRGGALGG